MFVAELLYNGASCLISLTLESSITGLHDGLVLLQVPELRTICKEFNMPASLTGKPKPVMVDSIVKYCKQHRPIFGSAGNLQGTILKRFKQKSNKYTLIPVFASISVTPSLSRVKALLGHCVKVCPVVAESLSQIVLIFSLSTTGYWQLDDDNDTQKIV